MIQKQTVDERVDQGDPDYSVDRVPPDARMSRLSLHMAYWAVISALFSVVFSSVLANAYGAVNTFVGTAAASVLLGIVASVVARFAMRTGMSVDVFSRTVFGKSGGLLATILVFGCLGLFAVIESAIIAEAIRGYFRQLEPWHAYLIVVMCSVPIAFGRISAYLDKFNGLLLPVFIAGMAYIVLSAISQNGYSEAWLSYGPNGGVLDGRCINVFFLWALGGAQLLAAQDYARFGRPDDETYHRHITFGIPLFFITYSVNGAVGIFITATVGSSLGALDSDAAAVAAIVALTGLAGVVFVIASQMRINTLNYQLATVNLQAFLKHIGIQITKVASALCVGALVFLLMLSNVLDMLVETLGYLGIFVGAWCAIAIVHMTLVGERTIICTHEKLESDGEGKFWHSSTVTWILSSGLGVAVMEFSEPTMALYATPTAIAAATFLHALHLKLTAKTRIESP
tara:strand:+ start:31565 stop:32932 length:1368 start_codon:yes stop_codon:yes gene_type:complete